LGNSGNASKYLNRASAKNRDWFNSVREEQSAVFRFYPGTLKRLSASNASELVLASILKAGGEKRKITPLANVPLIDARLPNSNRAQEIINEFVSAASSHGISNEQIARTIDRFGTRVAHIMRLPNWFQIGHRQILRGEFQLSMTTEHPANLAELLQRRLGVSADMSTADGLAALAELFV
jgi:hypothetical protein